MQVHGEFHVWSSKSVSAVISSLVIFFGFLLFLDIEQNRKTDSVTHGFVVVAAMLA